MWNIEKGKDREKEEAGGRLAKLIEKKGDRDLEREIKNKGDIFLLEAATWQFCSGGDKLRNARGPQCKVKVSGSEKKGNEKTYGILVHKTCN